MMLTRLYVDNYRALVNFSVDFKPKQLLLGLNGTGKTTVFDVLALLRDFVVEGEKCDRLFPPESLTCWDTRSLQTITLDVQAESGRFNYEVVIEHLQKHPWSRVKSEQLHLDDRPLFSFKDGDVHLFRDDHTSGPVYPFDWSRSGLATILPRHDNKHLTWFKQRLAHVYCVRIDAPRMSPQADDEVQHPSRDFSNFAAWYRNVWQGDTSVAASFLDAIRSVVAGLDGLDLRPEGQNTRILKASFTRDSENKAGSRKSRKPAELGFHQLSDGQRALIGLYALLHYALRPDRTLCIDEPDNFVALPELQPWLFGVMDRVDNENAQVLIASHHPELLDLLAPECGVVFERSGFGPVRVQPYTSETGSLLRPSELIARGWDRG